MQNYVGHELGHYRLLHLLGRGGFADVYLGEHIHLGTQAAIKIVRTQIGGMDLVQFEREAHTIAHLSHPHIVHILDYGVQDNLAYLAMEYAVHGTLRQRHPEGSLVPLETVVQYVKQIASALQHAHDQQLIHRDVKPENMLLGINSRVLLSDFGIAIAAHRTASLGTQDAIGTVTYMAPEQLRKKAVPASDQYALAVIAYEWLCGTPPFDGLPIEVALQHITDPIPFPRDRRPDLPLPVEQVLLRALAKEPAQRFPNIQAFAEALEQATLGIAPTPARPVGQGKMGERRIPGHPLQRGKDPRPAGKPHVPVILLTILILGIGGVLGTLLLYNQAHKTIQHTFVATPQPRTPATFQAPQSPDLPLGVSPGDWVQPGFDTQNTNYNSFEQSINTKNVVTLQQRWQLPGGSGMSVLGNGFDVANGLIYFLVGDRMSHKDSLIILSSQAGNVLKQMPISVITYDAAFYASTPTIVGHQLYYCRFSENDTYDLIMINLETGVSTIIGSIYEQELVLPLAAPVVVGNTLYGAASWRDAYALDTRTNTFLWQKPLADVTTTPAIANGVVYIGGSQHLYALDQQTGKLLWESQPERSGNTGVGNTYINGFYAPVVGAQLVYATENKQLLAYPLQCNTPCAPAWSYTADHIFRTAPSFARGIVYAGTGDWNGNNTFGAFDSKSGQLLWRAPVNMAVLTPPVIANSILYLQAGFELQAFPANGCGSSVCKNIWGTEGKESNTYVLSTIRVVKGSLYLLEPQETLTALGLKNP